LPEHGFYELVKSIDSILYLFITEVKMSNDFYNFFLRKADKSIEFYVKDSITADWEFPLPGDAPTDGQALVYNAAQSKFVWQSLSAGGGGTVTSVGLSLPNIFTVSNSPVTGTGTLTADLNSQTAKSFFAAPNGGNGAPSFRAIVASDLPNIPTSQITGVLANSQCPAGTNNLFFQLDADAAGGRLAWNLSPAEFQLRNSDGSAFADLRVKNLFVEGTTTTVNSENVEIADNILVLNSNVTGTPTENSGLEVERGTATNSRLLWNETTDKWSAGESTLLSVSRTSEGNFTNANVAGNLITIDHNLNNPRPSISIEDNNGVEIQFSATRVDNNSCTINVNRCTPLTGTWKWYARG
jgi:hypothetical protein